MDDLAVPRSAVSQAAALMGSVKSERKTAAVRENAKLGGRRPGTTLTPEHRAKIAEAARRRYADREAAPAAEPKRPRGRPRKSEGLGTAETDGSA